MEINKEIERLERLKSETTTACWLTSQMRLNLERAYGRRDERLLILKSLKDFVDKPKVLKTKDIVDEKIIIADYFKWDELYGLIRNFALGEKDVQN